ncbi:MAG TPA: hypothetical protein PLE33_06890 [Candidatus Cloacimonas sp.]|nr:hypothetical protein [Candidatus Cloacimonas sp.]HPS60974.1 hypothetical protein [Candidatus Cloacimonas sp.]
MVSKNLAVYIIYGSIFKFINPSNPYNPVHPRPIFFLSALSPQPLALSSQPSALSPLLSALSPQPSALCSQPSVKFILLILKS